MKSRMRTETIENTYQECVAGSGGCNTSVATQVSQHKLILLISIY